MAISEEDLYNDSVDLLILSLLIYEIVEIKQLMQTHGGVIDGSLLLDLDKKSPSSFVDLNAMIVQNLGLLYRATGNNSELKESLDAVGEYFQNKNNKRNVIENRMLYKIADDASATKASYVHAIAINYDRKRVEVIFRGTSRPGEWKTNLNVRRRTIDNPIELMKESLPHIHLHSGFASAIVGDPENTTPTYEIILKFVKDIIPDGYQLYVTGHSLGGATATIFAFFAATDDDITNSGPVQLYSFASPRVGKRSFRQAFQFLEERGKLRHARIHNMHDKVTHMPWIPWYFPRSQFKHVGMQMRFDETTPPDIDYPVAAGWLQKLPASIWEHIWTTRNLLKYHDCLEMRRRMEIAKPAMTSTSLEQEYRQVWGVEVIEGTGSDIGNDEL